MSYIFEALQRAEAERAGGNDPKQSDPVTELLQGVEQEIARKRLQTAGQLEASPEASVPSMEELRQEIERELAVERGEARVPASAMSSAAATLPGRPSNGNGLGDGLKVGAELVSGSGTRVADAAQGQAQEETQRGGQGRRHNPLHDQVQDQHRNNGQHLAEVSAAPVNASAVPPRRPDITEASAPAMSVVEAEPETQLAAGSSSPAPEWKTFADAKVVTSALPADSRLVCLTDQGGLPAEKFRVLGLKLRHMKERRKLNRIVVTGTAPEEGKSLVAANLALNQARSKVLKTLLIDGDLRRPTVASRFGFDGSLPGLSECLRGEKELAEVVYKLNGSGLWFLPAGRSPENPLELMQGGRLPELLERLGKFFDWIVIDTPPVVPVADTTFWMKLADGVLVVVREGVSEKKVVERAFASFDSAAMLGVVVNSCSRVDHKDYYSRYSETAARDKSATPERMTTKSF